MKKDIIKITFMTIREELRKNTKTSWGKNELIKHLDVIEEEMMNNERRN